MSQRRGNAADTSEAAAVLPYGGPQHVIVAGLPTAAGQGVDASFPTERGSRPPAGRRRCFKPSAA